MPALTILLVHGAWMNSACWDGFRARYESAGHTVLAPSWPHVPDDVAAARRGDDPALVDVGLDEIVASYEAVVRAQPGPVVLVGHSFGGLVVQLLLDRGVGVAGVAIDSAPPKGVKPSPSAARASLPVALHAGRVHTMTEPLFARDFANTSPAAVQQALWERYAVATPGRPFGQLLKGDAAKLHWKDPRPPLLMVAGEEDRTVTAKMNRANADRWERGPSETALVGLPHRDHALIVSEGWEEVADLSLAWLVEHAGSGQGTYTLPP